MGPTVIWGTANQQLPHGMKKQVKASTWLVALEQRHTQIGVEKPAASGRHAMHLGFIVRQLVDP